MANGWSNRFRRRLVIHTWPEMNPKTGGETARIISARKATRDERKAYEEESF
jgi:uncharacterized DUF497 family protein